jgi:predicted nucleic acid-binding Zn finger protein
VSKASDEIGMLIKICSKIRRNNVLEEKEKNVLSRIFSDRLERAMKIINEDGVTRYTFKPSNRIIWDIKGRSSSYQVIPTTPYCSCDDFYFRVLGIKRGVCYHLIAQYLASSLGKVKRIDLSDSVYDKVIVKLRPNIEE